MRFLPGDSKLKQLFWNHGNRDTRNHFLSILDIKKAKASAEIWLAPRRQSRVEGMMVYGNRTVQIDR